ncbi:peroxiredoxin [Fusibacter ferrireducens]|uniref:thioredoxin-dependent peroxiredoxin n=1 Tax=Fusibacter ferrireducens TaxID=2785058 RepID=A0ABR9ZX99_9FIRM|nr:peroxiredoxin [Fusibacter ferrireducens]MBF4694773.1 peroxiredoxin [Fusibacter ferrireducens]
MSYLKEDFTLNMTGGGQVDKAALLDQNFILYFYPKDNTSGCTLEAQDFADLYDEFKALGYEVYGISKDSLKSHEKFKEKFNLPFNLIADEEKILHKSFDVIKEKKMYGKLVKGTERSTFVFREGLLCITEFRGVKAKGHARAVLDYLQK